MTEAQIEELAKVMIAGMGGDAGRTALLPGVADTAMGKAFLRTHMNMARAAIAHLLARGWREPEREAGGG